MSAAGKLHDILSVTGLDVRFGSFMALERISLGVRPGERVALLGHNGAGKSTLFKTILGFIRPCAGTVSVGGHAPGSNAMRKLVSYLPEAVAFHKALTGAEILSYFARLKSEDPAEALALLERVGIGHAANKPAGTYSKGMLQRLGLAQALIGNPRLLLLDEPTSGLDPVSRREFYDIVDAAADQGSAVLLSSHSLHEVQGRTDRVAILSRGRLVADGSLQELANAAQLPATIHITVRGNDADGVARQLGGARFNGRCVVLTCLPDQKIQLLGRIAGLGDTVSDIDIGKPGLDDIYKHYSDLALKGDVR